MSESEIQQLAHEVLDSGGSDAEMVLAAECVKLYRERSMWYQAHAVAERQRDLLAEQIATAFEVAKPFLDEAEQSRDKY